MLHCPCRGLAGIAVIAAMKRACQVHTTRSYSRQYHEHISGNNTQNAAIPDKHHIELVASLRT
jgi:hypothetical protein